MYNHFAAMGRLTDDPKLQKSINDLPYVSFSLAVDRSYKADGKRPTDFIPCMAWNHNAQFLHDYFTKGSTLMVEGRIEAQPQDFNDESAVCRLCVNVTAIDFVSGSKTKNANNKNTDTSHTGK